MVGTRGWGGQSRDRSHTIKINEILVYANFLRQVCKLVPHLCQFKLSHVLRGRDTCFIYEDIVVHFGLDWQQVARHFLGHSLRLRRNRLRVKWTCNSATIFKCLVQLVWWLHQMDSSAYETTGLDKHCFFILRWLSNRLCTISSDFFLPFGT